MTKKIKILFLFFAFSLLFSTFGAFAAELKYFESSYDVAGSLILATAGLSFQYFITYDDYISGFDIWVENEGSSGTASFGLRDSNDNLLSAKTITVPYVARAPGGQKLHIVFDQPFNRDIKHRRRIQIDWSNWKDVLIPKKRVLT